MKFLFKSIFLQFIIVLLIPTASAQFAPAAGLQGSTAIHKDSSVIVAWANTCVIQRGLMDIAIPDSGYASVGDENSAIGQAGLNGIVSLGDGGVAILSFQSPIYNGIGFDFAVFENGFYTASPLAFLEFAFVEVSSDGNNFFRFPPTSNIQDTAQIPMTGVDCSLVNNLAGKYVSGYGTPFDLEELKNEVGLDVNNVTHIKLIDAVGSVNDQYATRDQFGNKVNDPYPTAFPSSGFDLDAVGVIHSIGISSIQADQSPDARFTAYPNPISRSLGCMLRISDKLVGSKFRITDVGGRVINEFDIQAANGRLSTDDYQPGIYFITNGTQITKLIIE